MAGAAPGISTKISPQKNPALHPEMGILGLRGHVSGILRVFGGIFWGSRIFISDLSWNLRVRSSLVSVAGWTVLSPRLHNSALCVPRSCNSLKNVKFRGARIRGQM